jgi:hypothetical protein
VCARTWVQCPPLMSFLSPPPTSSPHHRSTSGSLSIWIPLLLFHNCSCVCLWLGWEFGVFFVFFFWGAVLKACSFRLLVSPRKESWERWVSCFSCALKIVSPS